MAKKNLVVETVETTTQIDTPYELPEGWKWVQIQDLVNIYLGLTHTPNYFDSGIPFLSVKDMSDGYINFSNTKYISEEEYNSFPNGAKPKKGDILFARAGTIGIPQIIDTNQIFGIFVSLGYFRLIDENPDTKKYIVNWMNSLLFEHQVNKNIKGSTIKNLNTGWLKKFVIPLPPTIKEQQRIVNRIESMFAKLDEAKEKAQNVVDSFETRKAAILHQAFTGNLTAKWRKENGVSDDSWEEKIIGECCKLGSGGTPSKSHPEYYDNGNIPWLKTGEIDWNDICEVEEKITQEGVKNSSAKIYPAESVVIAMYGMGVTRGKAGILKIPTTTNQAVCVLQPDTALFNRYLFYYFMRNYWTFREKAVGGNQLNYSATMISKWTIDLPSLPEQHEIVSILDNVLEKELTAKSDAEQVLEQIDLLKKSILARAFRGEL